MILRCEPEYRKKMWIVDRGVREREKKNINDIEFQYVRSMNHLVIS